MKYRSRKNKIRRRIILCIIAAGLVALIVCMHVNVTRVLVSVAEGEMRAHAATAVNEAVLASLSDGVRYADLVSVERSADGKIRALTSNALAINRIARETAYAAQALLRQMCDDGVDIPLGAFTGIAAWAGFGAEVNMKIVSVSSVTCRFVSGFETAGINQTKHSVYLELVSDMSVVLPGRTHNFATISQVLIAESVLIGDVPNVYLQGDIFGKGYSLAPDAG